MPKKLPAFTVMFPRVKKERLEHLLRSSLMDPIKNFEALFEALSGKQLRQLGTLRGALYDGTRLRVTSARYTEEELSAALAVINKTVLPPE